MKKYIFGGLFAISLSLASCSKEATEPSQQAAQSEEYVEYELNLTSEEDNARVLLYGEDLNTPPKYNLFFGNDGDKVKVQTGIYVVDSKNQHEELFNEALDWEITRNGKRLVYKGKIPIVKDKISTSSKIKLIALAGREGKEQLYTKTNGFFALKDLTKVSPLSLDIPMLMFTDLKVAETQEKTLVSNATQTYNKSIFVPYGTIVRVTISNKLNIPITPTRALYKYRGEVLTSYYLRFTDNKTQPIDNTKEGGRIKTGMYGPTGQREYLHEPFPIGAVIAPNTTEHFIYWCPNFFDHEGFTTRFTFEFAESEAMTKQKVIETANLEGIANALFQPGKAVSYILSIE